MFKIKMANNNDEDYDGGDSDEAMKTMRMVMI